MRLRVTILMGWFGNGMSGSGWVFVGLFWIALIALIVWLVRLLPSKGTTSSTRAASGPKLAASGPESPHEILDRRLARGEIDAPTYRAHRAALTETRASER